MHCDRIMIYIFLYFLRSFCKHLFGTSSGIRCRWGSWSVMRTDYVSQSMLRLGMDKNMIAAHYMHSQLNVNNHKLMSKSAYLYFIY